MSPIRIQLLARMLVEEAYNGFLLHICRFSPSTQTTYGRALKRFIDGYAPKYVNQITAEHIEQFILTLRKTCLGSTCNLYLAVIKSWFDWLEATHEIRNVAKRVDRLKTLPPYQRILSQQEYRAVVKATSGHVRDCIVFLACTGLRASEFLSLKPENIGSQFITIIGKGQKQRSIPINSTVKAILKSNPTLKFLKSTNRVWLWRLCCRAAKLAKIPRFSPHSLRHYFATQLHHNGVPIDVIAKLLGHSNPLVTTQIYLHWQDKELLGVTDCLG